MAEEERYLREREELLDETQKITEEKEKEAVEQAEESPVKPMEVEVKRGEEGEAVIEYLRYTPILSLHFRQRIRITEFFTLFPLNPYFCRSFELSIPPSEITTKVKVIPSPTSIFQPNLIPQLTVSTLLHQTKTLITSLTKSITVGVS